MSNSPLVSYTKISPNRNSPRTHVIDTITIHCTAGQVTAETLGQLFAPKEKMVSSNYGIGKDGKIGMYVEEKDRSWCSSNAANDHRAVTIEVSSDSKEPYAVTASAYAALLTLVTDICKRNGITRLVWSDNKADRVNHRNGCNMTVHRDYAAKSCPGTYLYERQGEIAAEVNRRLSAIGASPSEESCPFEVGDQVEFLPSAATYYPDGPGIPSWVKTGYYHEVKAITNSGGKPTVKGGERCVLLGRKINRTTLKAETGINTWVSLRNLRKSDQAEVEPFKPYKVQVTSAALNIRKGPGTSFAVQGTITDKGIYTIVLEDATGKWGKLKSGAGWISLAYTSKVL